MSLSPLCVYATGAHRNTRRSSTCTVSDSFIQFYSKIEVIRRFLVKLPNIKFHEQFVCVETEGESDGQKVI